MQTKTLWQIFFNHRRIDQGSEETFDVLELPLLASDARTRRQSLLNRTARQGLRNRR